MSTFDFDGDTYEPLRDGERLGAQLQKVFTYMSDGQWHTIPEITSKVGNASPQSVSARLRDLRKPKFGGHVVERRYVQEGLFEYRLTAPAAAA